MRSEVDGSDWPGTLRSRRLRLEQVAATGAAHACGVARMLARNFPASRFLSAGASQALLAELPVARIAGGAVYDALVAAAAREHGVRLGTIDRKALDTYRALGVELEVLPIDR
jgi:hypothetical protein